MVKIILSKGTHVTMTNAAAVRAVEAAYRDSGLSKPEARQVAREIEVDLITGGRAWATDFGMLLVAV